MRLHRIWTMLLPCNTRENSRGKGCNRGGFSLATTASPQLIYSLPQVFGRRAGRMKRQTNTVAEEVVDVELIDLHRPIHAVFEHERHLLLSHMCYYSKTLRLCACAFRGVSRARYGARLQG